MDEVKIAQALKFWKQSVEEEDKGDIRKAHDLLKAAVAVFKEQIPLAPVKKKDVLEVVYKVNKDKLSSLGNPIFLTIIENILEKEEQETADSEDRNITKEDIMLYTGDNLYEKDFQDNELQKMKPKLEPLPKEPELRPFHMMRRIWNTMEGGGGFLTGSLYIPKYVWYQKKTLIPDIEKKVEYCEGIKKEFKKVAIVYRKNCLSKDKSELQSLVETLSSFQQMIYDDFPSLKPHSEEAKKPESAWNKLSKGFELIAHKITKGAFVTSTREYAKCLKDLFSETYFIEELCLNHIDDKLVFICQFLTEVVVSLALTDIKFLTSQYLKIMEKDSLLKKHDKEKTSYS